MIDGAKVGSQQTRRLNPVASERSILSALAFRWRKNLQRQLLPWQKCRRHRRCQRLWAARIARQGMSKQRQNKGKAKAKHRQS